MTICGRRSSRSCRPNQLATTVDRLASRIAQAAVDIANSREVVDVVESW
jgi:hypothetical protein